MIDLEFIHFVGTGDNLLCEPSGIAQLSQQDGRFVIVNDASPEMALFLARMGADGRLHSERLEFPESPELDDLEGVAVSGEWVFAICSHSCDDDEEDDSARRIVRFKIVGQNVLQLEDARGAQNLKKRVTRSLEAKHPQLDDEDFADEEFNIEGFANHDDEFLIGLRSPLVDDEAVLVKTYGLQNAFGNEPERYGVYACFVPLNLKRGGIRALSHIPDLGGYLLVSGKTVSGLEEFDCGLTAVPTVSKFLLWYWDGEKRCIQVACFEVEQDDIKIQPEGISPVFVDGRQSICIVSDDGDEDEGRPGRYCILSEAQYQELKERIN